MKILFPSDFSQVAENAFVFALKFAKKLNAQITVLHVYAVPEITPWVDLSNIFRELNETITLDEFDRFKGEVEVLKRIAKEYNLSDIEVNYSMRESGNVVPAIIGESKDTKADMIIMGTKGASGLREILLGSVASKVMEESGCPVLLVPELAVYKGMQQIGLTLDYAPEDKGLVKAALDFTRKIGAHLHCFHIDIIDLYKNTEKKNPLTAEFNKEADISFHTRYGLDLEKGILEYCEENHLDLLVMRVHHRNIFRELISYSLAKKVAYHIHIPLLTFHVATQD